MLTCILAAVLTALLLTPVGVKAVSLTCGGWSVVKSPNVGSKSNNLRGVAAVSTNDVWAVGNSRLKTLIEHWDGTSWSVVSSPNVGWADVLGAVTAISTSDVWAVGSYQNSSSLPFQTLIEHWDGSSWSVVPSPNVGSRENFLDGVAAVSVNNVWAVGYTEAVNGVGPFQTLIEHWDGTSWSAVPSPNVGSSDLDVLSGVAAVSASDVWAVGYYYTSSRDQTLIEHWNGSNWSIIASPNPSSAYNLLNGVAVSSASNVWAVGGYSNRPGFEQTLIEHWDGTTWHVVASPSPGTDANELYGVAAASASSIWAVGVYANTGGRSQTLIEHWNGASWKVGFSPNPGTLANALDAVAATASDTVWAVGGKQNHNSSFPQTLTEFRC